jgi:hypothetical protein
MHAELISQSRIQHEQSIETIHALQLQLQEAKQALEKAEADKVYFRNQSEAWSRPQHLSLSHCLSFLLPRL